jgi:hypothetical protein
MSAVFWSGIIPRYPFTFNNVDYPVGGGWVLDITTSSGSTQMWFYTAYPSPGAEQYADPPQYSYDALTETDSDNTADELQTAVNGLSGVTDSTLTALGITGVQGATFLFPQDDWQSYTFAITLPAQDGQTSDSAQLLTRSPADGMLSQGDIDTVTAALQTYIGGLDTVTDVDIVQQAVTPATA